MGCCWEEEDLSSISADHDNAKLVTVDDLNNCG